MLDLSAVAGHHKSLSFAPDAARCPRCGCLVPRHETSERRFWQGHLERTTILHLRFGYYLCPVCPRKQRAFALIPPAFRTESQYDLPTQTALLDLVDTGMSHTAVAAWAQTHFHLPVLAETTLIDWFRQREERRTDDLHRKRLLTNFSGQLTIDELYDGPWCVIRVTDPLQNVEIAWRLLEHAPAQEDVRTLLQELKQEGYDPQVVVTDGSTLYPAV